MTRPATNTTRRNGTVRCAIYTRKSSEEGLEQEFNSLQTRTRAVLAALSERIEVSVNQINIRLRPRRLNALLGVAATPIQGVIDDETEIVSVPVRLRRAGREIRMVIDGTDPFAASQPDARLIKLLLKARRFNATLVGSDASGCALPSSIMRATCPVILS